MKTRRIMRAAAIVRGSLLICALLVGLPGSGVTPSAWAQMPDNRGVKLNPEDSVPPAYRGTLDERDRLRLDAARRQGQSFVPVVQGQGRVQGYTAPANPLGAEPGQPANEPPPLLGRPGGDRAAPRPTYEAYSPSPREEGRPGRLRRRDIGSDERAAAELEQTAADRPYPLSGRQARNGRARHFRHTSRAAYPPAARGQTASMRARFMPLTRTIRDRC